MRNYPIKNRNGSKMLDLAEKLGARGRLIKGDDIAER
jgi:hypothetical protein